MPPPERLGRDRPREVRLDLPLRVGVAFTPDSSFAADPFNRAQEQVLLEWVAAAFRGEEGIERVEPIPSSHVTPEGGVDDLDRLRASFGIDLIALISHDQSSACECGEELETRTVVDAAIGETWGV